MRQLMKPYNVFKELLNNLKPFFKSYNYSKKGNSFYCLKEGNYGLITFQKSRQSTISKVIFTINMGIYSQALANFFTPESIKLQASIEDCHWTQRIKEQLTPFYEKWWSIDDQTSIIELSEEVQDHLKRSIVEIDEHISDKKLQSLWLSGQSPGITNLYRLMNLSVLLKYSGDVEQLKLVKEELKKISEDTKSTYIVKQHLLSL